jgi:hypothetical protein
LAAVRPLVRPKIIKKMKIKKFIWAGRPWFIPVIPATQEAEIKRIEV